MPPNNLLCSLTIDNCLAYSVFFILCLFCILSLMYLNKSHYFRKVELYFISKKIIYHYIIINVTTDVTTITRSRTNNSNTLLLFLKTYLVHLKL